MSVITTSELMERVAAAGSAVAAFNVISIEHAEGIVAGAESAGLPVILQLSENAIAYHGQARAIAAATVELARASSVDVSLIHISEPTRLGMISYAVFCLKKKKN